MEHDEDDAENKAKPKEEVSTYLQSSKGCGFILDQLLLLGHLVKEVLLDCFLLVD